MVVRKFAGRRRLGAAGASVWSGHEGFDAFFKNGAENCTPNCTPIVGTPWRHGGCPKFLIAFTMPSVLDSNFRVRCLTDWTQQNRPGSAPKIVRTFLKNPRILRRKNRGYCRPKIVHRNLFRMRSRVPKSRYENHPWKGIEIVRGSAPKIVRTFFLYPPELSFKIRQKSPSKIVKILAQKA